MSNEPTTKSSSPHPRGRPHGSQDAYKRRRTFTVKRPPESAMEIVLPPIKELVAAAIVVGQLEERGKLCKQAHKDVERATTIVLAAIKDVISNDRRNRRRKKAGEKET